MPVGVEYGRNGLGDRVTYDVTPPTPGRYADCARRPETTHPRGADHMTDDMLAKALEDAIRDDATRRTPTNGSPPPVANPGLVTNPETWQRDRLREAHRPDHDLEHLRRLRDTDRRATST
jgi:hypothetical protein